MDLLPSLKELKPIIDKNNTFFDCGFNVKFDNLLFKKKLQVLCDVVRESIYPNGFPNPDNDILEMNGNCYSSAFCFMNYVKKLNIGTNARCALVRKREFDPEEITSIHVVTFIDSNDGHIYQVDTTPFAGYKYGSVDDVTNKRIYDEYVIIDDNIKTLLKNFRQIIYNQSVNQFDYSKIREYLELCNLVEDYPIFKGYAALVLKIITKHLDNQYDKNELAKRLNVIKPYNNDNGDRIKELKDKLKVKTDIWMEELIDLKQSNSNPKRQSELAISIVQENKWVNGSLERYTNIDGKKIRLSSINPRYLYDKGYNTILIKSSNYSNSSNQIIKKVLIKESSYPIIEYIIDLSRPSEQLGLETTLFSHPNGEKYIKFISGDTKVLLLDDQVNDFGHHPIYNSADVNDTLISSLYFLIEYPEYQTMTRFMYPNPKLASKVKIT